MKPHRTQAKRASNGQGSAAPAAMGRSDRPWLSLAWWSGTKVGEVFGADLRSLAVLRIVLGCLVLMDLIGRSATYASTTPTRASSPARSSPRTCIPGAGP